MKRKGFKIEKLDLNSFIDLLIELYESGIDYIDMSSDNTEDGQDKLIIQTRDEYINPEWSENQGRTTTVETTKLSDEDINNLM